MALKVSGFRHVEIIREFICIGADDFAKFAKRPNVELAFDTFAVRILCGIEGATSIAHLTQDEVEGLFGDSLVRGAAGHTVGVQECSRQ